LLVTVPHTLVGFGLRLVYGRSLLVVVGWFGWFVLGSALRLLVTFTFTALVLGSFPTFGWLRLLVTFTVWFLVRSRCIAVWFVVGSCYVYVWLRLTTLVVWTLHPPLLPTFVVALRLRFTLRLLVVPLVVVATVPRC
jgi:hypothetical protein